MQRSALSMLAFPLPQAGAERRDGLNTSSNSVSLHFWNDTLHSVSYIRDDDENLSCVRTYTDSIRVYVATSRGNSSSVRGRAYVDAYSGRLDRNMLYADGESKLAQGLVNHQAISYTRS